jgi:hypothetical protein
LIYVDDLAEAGALDETAPGADLGARVVGLGDVDGDGYADFAATVPGDEVRVQFGGPSWNPADGVVVRAAAELRYFAHDIAAVGDRDSDGLADLAILSRLAMDLARIEVYSFAGSAPRRIEMHDVPTGEALATSEPPPVVITGGYDMDDDGLPDIAVGQRLLSNLVILFAGTRRDQTGSSESVAFGAAVAAGDVDGTGRARIVVGDPLVVGPIGGGEAGKLVLVSYTGAPFVLLANPYFTSDDDHLGHEVTIVDLNGDGLDDFFTRSESGFLLDRLRFDTAVGGVRGDRLLFAPSGRSWLAMTR